MTKIDKGDFMMRFYRHNLCTLTMRELYALAVVYGLEKPGNFETPFKHKILYDGTFARQSDFQTDLDSLLEKKFLVMATYDDNDYIHMTTKLGRAYIEDFVKGHLSLLLEGFGVDLINAGGD